MLCLTLWAQVLGNGLCVVLKLDVCSPPGFWAGGALLGSSHLCMILHGPSPSPSADPQLRVGMSWGRAGGGQSWGQEGRDGNQGLPSTFLIPRDCSHMTGQGSPAAGGGLLGGV